MFCNPKIFFKKIDVATPEIANFIAVEKLDIFYHLGQILSAPYSRRMLIKQFIQYLIMN